MAFCISCGHELAEEAKYCANCGKAVNNSATTEKDKTNGCIFIARFLEHSEFKHNSC